MKRALYILISLIIFNSCESSNELEGVWIGAYQIHYSSNEPSLSSMRELLDFSSNQIIYKSFDYPSLEEKDTIKAFKYSLKDNKLIFDSDTFLIKNITQDSLVLSYYSTYKRDLVFKRIIKRDKKINIELKEKAFRIIGPNYSDSIDFITDSLILNIGNVFNTNYRLTKWAINSYKSFDFLVFDHFDSPPLLIEKSSENEILLKLFHTSIQDFKMTKIEKKNEISGIVGNWVWPFQDGQGFPLPPPPLSYPENIDTKLYLRIRTDSIEIEQYGKVRSEKWKLNSTNGFIYFPEKIKTKYGVWKILKLNRDELIIERNIRFYSRDKEKIKFEKIINSR